MLRTSRGIDEKSQIQALDRTQPGLYAMLRTTACAGGST